VQSAEHGEPSQRLLREHRARALVLLLLVAAAVAAAASEPAHRLTDAVTGWVREVLGSHAVAGAVVFVLLSAASAMVVFFSASVITPVAVSLLGPGVTLLLLWLGWVLGGVTAYAIGRFLGHRVAGWFVSAERLREYEARARRLVTFPHVLLFQLAVPSEIPGYVLGLAGCRFRPFLLGVALAELPFAVGAVYLGESFLRRNYVALAALGIAGVAWSWFAVRTLAARWAAAANETPGSTSASRPARPTAH
jgi:uncharacterized membrane protein YdjX (TVP38/TMEM64 family)